MLVRRTPDGVDLGRSRFPWALPDGMSSTTYSRGCNTPVMSRVWRLISDSSIDTPVAAEFEPMAVAHWPSSVRDGHSMTVLARAFFVQHLSFLGSAVYSGGSITRSTHRRHRRAISLQFVFLRLRSLPGALGSPWRLREAGYSGYAGKGTWHGLCRGDSPLPRTTSSPDF